MSILEATQWKAKENKELNWKHMEKGGESSISC